MLNKDNAIELPIVDKEEENTKGRDTELKEEFNYEDDQDHFSLHEQIKRMKPTELKISRAEIENLTEIYSPENYDYNISSKPFLKKMIERGIEPPDLKTKELPLMYRLYLECIWNIFKISLIFSICQAIPIYLTALLGLKLKFFDIMLSHRLYFFIVTPFTYIYSAKMYNILEHIISPLSVILMSILFIKAIKNFEERMVSEINRSKMRNSMHCVRLKNLELNAEDELSCQVDLIMEKVVKKDVVLIRDSHLIEKKMNEYFELELQIRILRYKLNNLLEEKSEKLKKKEIELAKKRSDLTIDIKKINKKLINNSLDLKSRYGFICFYSYKHMSEFREQLQKKKAEYPKMSKVIALNAPEPYDIDWNNYARPYKAKIFGLHFIMCILFWVISPAVTYFCENMLSYGLARAVLMISGNSKNSSDGIIENTYSFMLIRVLASSCYGLVCSLAIDFYYEKREFKTYSGNIRSKFYFFNTYFLLNQIVADFYGIISAVIKDLDSKKTQNILVGYSNYIFSASLKVGLMLCLSPYMLKFVDYIPKFFNKMRIKFSIFGPKFNLNKVIADLPVEHKIDIMGSFVVQCIFFLGFFESFMMPILSFLIVLGLFIFYKFESYMLRKHQARKIVLSLNQVKMIYTVSYFGFLLIQPLAIGNVTLVLKYFDEFDFNSLKRLVMSSLDYTILMILILIGMVITYNFRETAIKKRILDKLVKESKEKEDAKEEHVENDGGPYQSRNPIFKAKSGVYVTNYGD